MAIFHLRMQVLGRSNGHSAVAAAGYRSGEKLHDERQEITHDYSRKGGVVYSEIMLPEGAPERFTDRATLWNEVEASETRVNSQLAREFNVALPHELNAEQKRELLRGYVQAEFVDSGMVADVNIHGEGTDNDHGHVMLTMRECDSEGFTVKNRSWNHPSNMQGWREAWEEHANAALEAAGSEEHIDHRTLDKQGIDREPGQHLGKAAAMEARGLDTEPGARQADIDRDNAFKAGFAALEGADDATELEERLSWQRDRQPEPDTGDEWADWRDYAAQRDYGNWQRNNPDPWEEREISR